MIILDLVGFKEIPHSGLARYQQMPNILSVFEVDSEKVHLLTRPIKHSTCTYLSISNFYDSSNIYKETRQYHSQPIIAPQSNLPLIYIFY